MVPNQPSPFGKSPRSEQLIGVAMLTEKPLGRVVAAQLQVAIFPQLLPRAL
jgi:hypothetical protein